VTTSLLTPTDGGIVTADGRRLAFAEYGDPAGRPCLYFHFTPGSRLDPLVVFHDKAELLDGIRLVAIDRPGFGRSDRQPGRTFLDWPADVTAVTDQLGINTFSVLEVSARGRLRTGLRVCDP
jgi:pimeloyl-ACP methyl ester carboxylesterase